MGWTYGRSWRTKADLVKYLCEENGVRTVTKAIKRGSGNYVLWAVQEYEREGKTTRFLACYLMASGNRQGMGWGYKDMDESMGPCDVNCPLDFLDMVPDPGGYATEWRERVRAAAVQGGD